MLLHGSAAHVSFQLLPCSAHKGRSALQGMNMSMLFLDALESTGVSVEQANAGVVVQCFDLDALKEFASVQANRGYDMPLVWLVSCDMGLPSSEDLTALSELATLTAVACAPCHFAMC